MGQALGSNPESDIAIAGLELYDGFANTLDVSALPLGHYRMAVACHPLPGTRSIEASEDRSRQSYNDTLQCEAANDFGPVFKVAAAQWQDDAAAAPNFMAAAQHSDDAAAFPASIKPLQKPGSPKLHFPEDLSSLHRTTPVSVVTISIAIHPTAESSLKGLETSTSHASTRPDCKIQGEEQQLAMWFGRIFLGVLVLLLHKMAAGTR